MDDDKGAEVGGVGAELDGLEVTADVDVVADDGQGVDVGAHLAALVTYLEDAILGAERVPVGAVPVGDILGGGTARRLEGAAGVENAVAVDQGIDRAVDAAAEGRPLAGLQVHAGHMAGRHAADLGEVAAGIEEAVAYGQGRDVVVGITDVVPALAVPHGDVLRRNAARPGELAADIDVAGIIRRHGIGLARRIAVVGVDALAERQPFAAQQQRNVVDALAGDRAEVAAGDRPAVAGCQRIDLVVAFVGDAACHLVPARAVPGCDQVDCLAARGFEVAAGVEDAVAKGQRADRRVRRVLLDLDAGAEGAPLAAGVLGDVVDGLAAGTVEVAAGIEGVVAVGQGRDLAQVVVTVFDHADAAAHGRPVGAVPLGDRVHRFVVGQLKAAAGHQHVADGEQGAHLALGAPVVVPVPFADAHAERLPVGAVPGGDIVGRNTVDLGELAADDQAAVVHCRCAQPAAAAVLVGGAVTGAHGRPLRAVPVRQCRWR